MATIPWRPSTSERVWSAQPLARSPRTFWIVRPGVGTAAVGAPNGDGPGVCATVYPAPPTSTVPMASVDTSRTRDFIYDPPGRSPLCAPETTGRRMSGC